MNNSDILLNLKKKEAALVIQLDTTRAAIKAVNDLDEAERLIIPEFDNVKADKSTDRIKIPRGHIPTRWTVKDRDSKFTRHYNLIIGTFNNQLEMRDSMNPKKNRQISIKQDPDKAAQQLRNLVYNAKNSGHTISIESTQPAEMLKATPKATTV